MVDLHSDGAQGEDRLYAVLAHIDVELDVYPALVEFEGSDPFVGEAEEALVGVQPETYFVRP